MQNISAFGIQISLLASNTYPAGVTLTQFSDDTDSVDVPTLQIADSAMGINGDLIVWSKANPIKFTMSVLPNTDSDRTLGILFEANRPGRGKTGAQDIITLNIAYPAGNIVQLINGAITEGYPFSGAQSTGRLKTKLYGFTFESRAGGF